MKAAIVLQPLLGITNILQILFNPYNVRPRCARLQFTALIAVGRLLFHLLVCYNLLPRKLPGILRRSLLLLLQQGGAESGE